MHFPWRAQARYYISWRLQHLLLQISPNLQKLVSRKLKLSIVLLPWHLFWGVTFAQGYQYFSSQSFIERIIEGKKVIEMKMFKWNTEHVFVLGILIFFFLLIYVPVYLSFEPETNPIRRRLQRITQIRKCLFPILNKTGRVAIFFLQILRQAMIFLSGKYL